MKEQVDLPGEIEDAEGLDSQIHTLHFTTDELEFLFATLSHKGTSIGTPEHPLLPPQGWSAFETITKALKNS